MGLWTESLIALYVVLPQSIIMRLFVKQAKIVNIKYSRQKNQIVFDRILWFQDDTGTEA